MFFTSLYVGKMDNRRVRIRPEKQNSKKIVFASSCAEKKENFWAFTNICQRRARRESGEEEGNLTPNKQSKQTCNAMFERAKQNTRLSHGKLCGESVFNYFVMRDKQHRLCCSLFWRFHSYLIVIEAIYIPSSRGASTKWPTKWKKESLPISSRKEVESLWSWRDLKPRASHRSLLFFAGFLVWFSRRQFGSRERTN